MSLKTEYDMNKSMKSNDPQKANVHMNVAKNENPVSDKQLQSVICNLTMSFDT